MPLSRRLSEYAASYLSPYIKLDDEGCTTAADEGNASFSASKPHTQSSLSVGLWSGYVELKNVELRPDAIENFLNNNSTSKDSDGDVNDSDGGNNYRGAKVRWKLLQGRIESVNIQIPWTSLLVGSSHSSLKRSSEKNSQGTLTSLSQTEGGEKDVVADCEQIHQKEGEEGAETVTSGCTMVNIEGMRLQIGYEIIHEDPLLMKLQSNTEKNGGDDLNLPGQDPGSDPSPLDGVQQKIREERNRILQIAERRLLAGLDPFPPSLVAGLQSIIASSIQSGMKSASNISSSSGTIQSKNRLGGGYLAMMEDYVSSTMRNIVWRTFDSLSLSIVYVHISMVGCSHYDNDVEATLRKLNAERKKREKEEEEKEYSPKQNDSRHRRGSGLKTPKMRNLSTRMRHDRTFSLLHRSEYLVPGELEIESNKTQQQVEGGNQVETGEDTFSAHEGEIEIGFLLDRFDVRPASSSDQSFGTESESVTNEDSSAATSDKGPSALKHFRISNFGVFLRRSCKQSKADEPSFWSDLKNDDFILDPTNIEASVRLYRSNPEGAFETSATGTTSTNLSSRTRSRGQSSTVKTETTSESVGTSGTKRRGKRDKKPVARPSQTYHLRKRSRRLESSVQLGHVRSSVSPRQLFLLDSVCSSIDRLKRGRPFTTIRSAKTHDEILIERMTEEGQPLIDWDDHIIKAIPSLRSSRSSKSPRTLPTVIASWWKYAYISVVHENHRRQVLLDRCRGTDIQIKRRNSLTLNLKSGRNWDWEKQTKIRRDYVELYLIAQASTMGTDVSVTAIAAANIRLEELEDQLSVERILLLKNVARAASIRKNDFESLSDRSKSDDSTSIGEYFCFPPNFLENGGRLGPSQRNSGWRRRSSEYLALSNSIHSIEEHITGGTNSTTASAQVKTTRLVTKNATGPSDNSALSHLSDLPRSSKTFFFVVKVSGVSLALCNFGEEDRESREASEEQKFNIPDDISALTGFSDVDDASVGRIKVQQMPDERLPADKYVPNCRFWTNLRRGLCYEPIMLMHVVGISVSGQNVDGDHARVECEFSIGGLDVVTCASPSSPKRIISLGQVPTEETSDVLMSPLPHINKPSEATGICGIASLALGVDKKQNLSVMTNVSPTVVMVDWAGLEKVAAFVTESKDISKKDILPPFEDEALLRDAFSPKNPTSNMSFELEWNKMSLAIPTLDEHCANDIEGQYLITTLDSLSLKTGYSSIKAYEKGRDISVPFLNERSNGNEPGMVSAFSRCQKCYSSCL